MEEKITYETMKGILRGISQEEKRNVFVFEVTGKKYEFKVSVFKPNLPEVIVGKTYEFKVMHKPMGGLETGKFFHNLCRVSKDGNYDIKEIPMEEPKKEEQKSEFKPANEYKPTEKKEVDWDSKDRRIVRQNSLTQANVFLSTFIRNSSIPIDRKHLYENELFKLAEKCEAWVYRDATKPLKEAIEEAKKEHTEKLEGKSDDEKSKELEAFLE